MSRYTLLVMPDGKGFLTTEEGLSEKEVEQLRFAFERWRESDKGIAILASCSVEKVTSLDLDFESVVQ